MEGGAEDGVARGVISSFLKSSLVSLDLGKSSQRVRVLLVLLVLLTPESLCLGNSLSCGPVVVHVVALRGQRVGVALSCTNNSK